MEKKVPGKSHPEKNREKGGKRGGEDAVKKAAEDGGRSSDSRRLIPVCQNPFDGSRTAFAAGPGTPAYGQGDPYNSYQWAFLNNGQFRLVTGTQNMNSSMPGHLSDSRTAPTMGLRQRGGPLPLPGRAWILT